jgi:hypothetical protein
MALLTKWMGRDFRCCSGGEAQPLVFVNTDTITLLNYKILFTLLRHLTLTLSIQLPYSIVLPYFNSKIKL